MMTSKKAEIEAAGKAVETKTARSGTVAVETVQAKADLEKTQKAVEEDTTFKANLKKNCAIKQKEWDERCKVRAEEIQAISETIEMLNSDDALELFKKTLPSASGSLLQFSAGSQVRGRAAALVRALMARDHTHAVSLKMILMMLKSKSGGFGKVTEMVKNMVTVLEKEQAEADTKKDFCHEELHKAQAEELAIKGEVKDSVTDIDEKADAIASVKAEIEALQAGVVALDKMVAGATEQRKSEHAEYTSTRAANSAALELIEMAKNRMNKFYQPSLYKAPPTTTVSESVYGFVQIAQHSHRSHQPGPAPETFGEMKKNAGGTGIIAMMEQMAKDVEMDIKEATMDEASAQKEYTESMADAAAKRAGDSKLIVEKEGAKASQAEELSTARELLASKREQLSIAGDKLNNLHRSCDAFLADFDEAKAARAKEMDGLKESLSILAGAR